MRWWSSIARRSSAAARRTGRQPPGVTDAESGFRRGPVYLEAGYHELRILSRHEAGSARLRVRWTLPWMSRPVTLPAEQLMPVDASPRELALRGVALAGRRIGVLGLVVVAVWALAAALRSVSERLLGWAPVRIDCASGAGLAVLFLVLTATPLLIWPEHRPEIAPLLLAACVPGTLAIGVRRIPPGAPARAGGHGCWTGRLGDRRDPRLAAADPAPRAGRPGRPIPRVRRRPAPASGGSQLVPLPVPRAAPHPAAAARIRSVVERGRGRSERDAVRRDGDPRDLLAAAHGVAAARRLCRDRRAGRRGFRPVVSLRDGADPRRLPRSRRCWQGSWPSRPATSTSGGSWGTARCPRWSRRRWPH